MNRCPSCHNLVPAGWIACRRCGAALTAGRPASAVEPASDKALPRRSALPGGIAAVSATATATLTRAAPAVASAPTPYDTLLPGRQTDTLISARSRVRPRDRRRAYVAVSVLGATAVALVAWAIVAAVSGGTTAASDARVRSEKLIRQAAVAAAPLFAAQKTYTAVTPVALAHASGLAIVSANTKAPEGTLSIRALSDTRLIFATPASDTTCVFGRDDAGNVVFAFTNGRACRASAAPKYGWGTAS